MLSFDDQKRKYLQAYKSMAGFSKHDNRILTDGHMSKMKGAEFMVYYALVKHFNTESGLCCPSIQTLADEIGRSKRSVQMALEQLQDYGMIIKKSRVKSASRNPITGQIKTMRNEYVIVTPDDICTVAKEREKPEMHLPLSDRDCAPNTNIRLNPVSERPREIEEIDFGEAELDFMHFEEYESEAKTIELYEHESGCFERYNLVNIDPEEYALDNRNFEGYELDDIIVEDDDLPSKCTFEEIEKTQIRIAKVVNSSLAQDHFGAYELQEFSKNMIYLVQKYGFTDNGLNNIIWSYDAPWSGMDKNACSLWELEKLYSENFNKKRIAPF